MKIKEHKIELDFIKKLEDIKYIYKKDIKDKNSLEQNFRDKFEELNRVNLTDNEFNRLLEDIISSDVFKNSKLLREKQSFEREDGTPLYYTQGLESNPSEVVNLKGDNAKVEFAKRFKEIQKLKTNLEKYTDLSDKQKQAIEDIIPTDTIRAYKGAYLDIASNLREQQNKDDNQNKGLEQLDFEFVLFASTIIDHDYIMNLISQCSHVKPQEYMTEKEQIINIIKSSSNLIYEKDDMIEYINSLGVGIVLSKSDVEDGYEEFKKAKNDNALISIANNHNIELKSLKEFVELIISRMIFDGELLTDLLEPLSLGWKDRRVKELALMQELSPLLRKMVQDKEISGLEVYDE